MTILDLTGGGRGDLARRSVHPRAQDVDRAHHVARAGVAAPPAGVDPPGGLVSHLARRAGLGGVGFILGGWGRGNL